MKQPPQPKSPLSPYCSFVVQFRTDTGMEPAAYDGRIEHVTSGQKTLFSSPEELLTFITRVLANVRMASSHDR